jgi:hypothetical protein
VVWERSWSSTPALALVAAATVAPLVYFFALSHTDSAWRSVSRAADYPHFGLWFFAAVVPLALLMLPGLLARPRSTGERLLRIWPLAALAVYVILQSTWF